MSKFLIYFIINMLNIFYRSAMVAIISGIFVVIFNFVVGRANIGVVKTGLIMFAVIFLIEFLRKMFSNQRNGK